MFLWEFLAGQVNFLGQSMIRVRNLKFFFCPAQAVLIVEAALVGHRGPGHFCPFNVSSGV